MTAAQRDHVRCIAASLRAAGAAIASSSTMMHGLGLRLDRVFEAADLATRTLALAEQLEAVAREL